MNADVPATVWNGSGDAAEERRSCLSVAVCLSEEKKEKERLRKKERKKEIGFDVKSELLLFFILFSFFFLIGCLGSVSMIKNV